ncbi:MAG: hypothetical protein RLZZ369_1677, partial [Pseudomonadota bacterium]
MTQRLSPVPSQPTSSRRRFVQIAFGCVAGVPALMACSPDVAKFKSTDVTGATFAENLRLKDQYGSVRTLKDFNGKIVVVFFGYTQCPDVCPTTLMGMAEVMKLLGKAAANVQVLFITLDPERDTKDLLAAYVTQFDPSFVGLYGDKPTTAATALGFKVFFQKQPGSTPKTYSIDHSANSYI